MAYWGLFNGSFTRAIVEIFRWNIFMNAIYMLYIQVCIRTVRNGLNQDEFDIFFILWISVHISSGVSCLLLFRDMYMLLYQLVIPVQDYHWFNYFVRTFFLENALLNAKIKISPKFLNCCCKWKFCEIVINTLCSHNSIHITITLTSQI